MDTETNPSSGPDVSSTLDYRLGAPAPWKRWVLWGALAIVALVVGWLILGRGGGGANKYVTQEVMCGGLIVIVIAIGNLELCN